MHISLALALYLALDLAWFSAAVPRLYAPAFRAVQGLAPGAPLRFRLAYAAPAYALLGAGLWYFVWRPCRTRAAAARAAAALALLVYGTYNLTNLATLHAYPVSVALADTAWGLVAFGLVAQAGFYHHGSTFEVR